MRSRTSSRGSCGVHAQGFKSRPATNSSIFVFILNIELYIWNTCIMYKFMIVISYHHAIMPHEYSFFS